MQKCVSIYIYRNIYIYIYIIYIDQNYIGMSSL